MNTDKKELREKFRKLFVMAVSDNEGEADNARRKLLELRKSLGLTESDVLELMAGADEEARTAFEAFMQGSRKQADILIDLAKAASIFRTPDGRAWADININGHRETHPVRSAPFKRWLQLQFFNDQHGSPSKDAIETCVCHYEAVAQHGKAPTHEVHIRIAGLRDKVFLDLCDEDWTVVEIDSSGWRVVKDPAVRFQRSPGMLPLPAPVKGGHLNSLRALVHVASENDFVIMVAILLAALRGKPPYPILALTGPTGSSKSTSLRILRDLLDPNELEPGALSREQRDLMIAATKRFFLAFDNLSGIKDELSDALCRLSTGGGFATRTLYSDDDERVFNATRPVMLAGIEDVVGRHDLSDRTSSLSLSYISEDDRQLVADMRARFERARPGILGRLLDVVAHGLSREGTIRLERKSRMADYENWITACENLVWEPGTFAEAHRANKADLFTAAIEADLVAQTVIHLMKDTKGHWRGTASELLPLLGTYISEDQRKDRDWPKKAHVLSGRLRRADTILRPRGIKVMFEHEGRDNAKRRVIVITAAPDKPPKTASPAFPATPQEKTQQYQRSSGDAGGDASPGGDAPIAAGDAGSNEATPSNLLKNKAGDDGDSGDAPLQPLSGGEGVTGQPPIWPDLPESLRRGPPEPLEPLCAHCGQGAHYKECGPLIEMSVAGSPAVRLHRDCEEAWMRGQLPAGRQISDYPSDRRDADVVTSAARVWIREEEPVQ
jgi:hypothetical protein